ncbi:hypothetical protein K3495_g6574 [Podosphaera aphanis]|nr:hypothetical protein K3495_g6574 [Podosphaera aphanis]
MPEIKAESSLSKPLSTPIPSLKFDKLPILTGSENYRCWAGSWQIAFDSMGFWEILTGETPRPDDTNSPDYENWKLSNKHVRAAILNAVDESLQTIVIDHPTAKEAWDKLQQRFDRETPNSTISLLKSITNLSLQDGENINDFLTTFNDAWNRLKNRSSSAKTPLAKIFRDLTHSEEAKGAFLLSSLPPSFDNIVENLLIKELTSYDDVSVKLMDMSISREITITDDNRALVTHDANQSNPSDLICTYCKARDRQYTGHTYKTCNFLHERHLKKKEMKNSAKLAKQLHDNNVTFEKDRELYRPDTSFVANFQSKSKNTGWVFDTGASAHMTGCKSDFDKLTPFQGHNVEVANNSTTPIFGKGTVRLNLRNRKNQIRTTILNDVLYVPSFGNTRLFYWNIASKKGVTMEGKEGDIVLKDQSGNEVLWARCEGKCHIVQTQYNNALFSSYSEFHEALGHPSPSIIKNPTKIFNTDSKIPSLPPNFHCSSCEVSKSKHFVPKPIGEKSTQPFELIHTDLSGKFSNPSMGGKFYYISFIDSFTRLSWVKFLRTKDESTEFIINFIIFLQTQFNHKIKKWRTDHGGEFDNKAVKSYFNSKGIVHEFSPPYEHERNGIAERFNQTITTMARTMIINQNPNLWAEAISTACYLKNRLPHSRFPTGITPYEALYKEKPSINHLQPFGTKCYIHIHKDSRRPGTMLRAQGCEFPTQYLGVPYFMLILGDAKTPVVKCPCIINPSRPRRI